MLKLLKDAFKVKDIRSRILFTVFILFIFRVGTHITIPGVNAASLQSIADLPFLNMLNLVSGSSIQRFSIFAMGVSPYITASIIVQLLQMDIVPKFVEWSKQGEVGRRKLNQATRYITLVLAFAQSVTITAGFNYFTQLGFVKNPTVTTFILIGFILTTGTMFVTWLGEQITEKGIGNGVSMIIFAGIIAQMPGSIKEIVEDYFINIESSQLWKSALFALALILIVLIVVTFVTYVQQAERKIPIQYTKRMTGAPTSSYLPLKVNAAGVIPVIFASSFLTTPSAIIQALASSHSDEQWYQVVTTLFSYNTVPGAALYTVLIVGFTFINAFVQVNPEKLDEIIQKQGSYIPSIRPGRGTEEYVSGLLMRLSTVGSLFLGVVALLPIIAQMVWQLPGSIGLGGTSLLIVICVALDSAKQLERLMLKRKYTGFIN